MSDHDRLAESFEQSRAHLRAVAYRMLGSLTEAEDAVQEAWLRLARSGSGEVENLEGWLTTVVARVCLDMLRSRKARPEEPLAPGAPEPAAGGNPEEEAALADSVGVALLVVLEHLAPAERVAFVLHDTFGVPFEDIARILGKSPAAARQLASRARRRVQGKPAASGADLAGQREVVGAFLSALRRGDFEALVSVLDPDVVVRIGPKEIRGARNWAKGAIAFARQLRFAQPALVDGAVGIVLAPRGRLSRALRIGFRNGKIADVDIIAEPEGLRRLDVAVLEA